MTKVRARFTLHFNFGGVMESTGEIDEDGRVKTRPKVTIILPGQTFELEDQDELARLVELRGIDILDTQHPLYETSYCPVEGSEHRPPPVETAAQQRARAREIEAQQEMYALLGVMPPEPQNAARYPRPRHRHDATTPTGSIVRSPVGNSEYDE